MLTPAEENPVERLFGATWASAAAEELQLWMKREYASAPARSQCLLILHPGHLARLTLGPARPRTDPRSSMTWQRGGAQGWAKARHVSGSSTFWPGKCPDLCLNQPGKRKEVRSRKVQASFQWRTMEGLSFGADVTKAPVKTVR